MNVNASCQTQIMGWVKRLRIMYMIQSPLNNNIDLSKSSVV